MSASLTRRDVLRALAAGAALPIRELGAAPKRRSIAIVGAGMAGVSLAWLLDGAYDVVLIEARESIGGNVRSVEIELDGGRILVDMGAQYFHPAPYPAYTALLEHLHLYDPHNVGASLTHPFTASFTLTARSEPLPRFVSPALPERWWPLLAPWNVAGLLTFGYGFIVASIREQLNQSWDLTLGDWLPTLGLAREHWEGMLLPWTASLFSGNVDEARRLSARAAMIFAAKALPPNLLDPISYYVLKPGLIAALTRMIAECDTVQVLTGSPVLDVTREVKGGFKLRCARGAPIRVDELAFASSGPPTARLLSGLAGTAPQQNAVSGIEFRGARLALHTDPIYAPANPELRSFLNSDISGGYCEASMWLASILADPPPATAARLWKSWITHRDRPKQVLYETEFDHMLPTTESLAAQDRVARLQGLGGVWFTGGYLYPYDSQETALRSALRVSQGLHVSSTRSQLLLAALGGIPI